MPETRPYSEYGLPPVTTGVYVPHLPFERSPYGVLLNTAIDALQYTRTRVREMQADGSALERAAYTASDGSSKLMLAVDKVAERECRSYLLANLPNICVLGEELLWPKMFKQLDMRRQHVIGKIVTGDPNQDSPEIKEGAETKTTFILDMIDGSDLIERGLGNWCSAMVVFHPGPHPNPPKILFSLVQNADDTIYGADEQGTFKIGPGSKRGQDLPRLRGPQRRVLTRRNLDLQLPEECEQIAVCFYGQQVDHLTSLPSGVFSWFDSLSQTIKNRFRIYNLAGNPMMVRLANGENIHAVFEHRGQFAHDAAPGAYIALKAEAPLIDLATGNRITEKDLTVGLLTPSLAKFRYALASTEDLALALASALRQRIRTSHAFCECEGNCKPGHGIVLPKVEIGRTCDSCKIHPMVAIDRRKISGSFAQN